METKIANFDRIGRNLDNLIKFRMFQEEEEIMKKIVLHKRTNDGLRKFESRSHFIRCAVIRLIREELKTLEIKPGRPKKK